MKKWIAGLIFGRVLTGDVSAANEFVQGARRRIQTEDNRDEIALAFIGGLEFMVDNLTKHLKTERENVLSAAGFDNETLDKVYRYAIGGAQKASPMLDSQSPTAQNEGLKMSFGCLIISHLYRLRFLETQVSGEKLRVVQNAIENVRGLMRDLLTFSVPTAR